MGNTSETAAIMEEKNDEGREWAQQSEERDGDVFEEEEGAQMAEYSTTRALKRKAKKKDEGPLESFCGMIVDHQIGLSVNLLVLLALTHLCFPRARRHTRKFYQLSYYNEDTGLYCAGWNDAFMVSFWIVVFTGLRAAVMDYILMPLAKKGGVKTLRDVTRFAEQAWLLVFYTVFWPLGMYILINSEYWFNFKGLWTNWPSREIDGLLKWYTLAQYAFWLQQILVINIEARRKDHWQMFTHHIVTTTLIFTAYGYHQTRVANLILCMMDVVDIVLPVAKCLKYLGYTTITDCLFGLFIAVWFMARHVIYLAICWSVYADIPEVINYGCYRGKASNIEGPFPIPDRFAHLIDPFRNPEGVVCWNDSIKWAFLSALLFLQGITLMWFWMILKVAVKVLRGGVADDIRSDDEADAEDDEVFDEEDWDEKTDVQEKEELLPYEEEVGVESINFNGRTSANGNGAAAKRYRKGASSATGVSIAGHSVDRKELLGRIGCDKGV